LIQNYVLQNYGRSQYRNFFLTYRKSRNHLQALTRMNAYHISEFGTYASHIVYSEGDREEESARLETFGGFYAQKQFKNFLFKRIAFFGIRCNKSEDILEDLR
jgi:hypothetical protein